MAAWNGRSRGGVWLQYLLAAMVHRLGYGGIHMLSWVGAVIGMLLVPAVRRAAENYQRRRRPELDRLTALGLAWRQCASFGRVLCDRALVYGPRQLHLTHSGGRHLWQAVHSGQGCVFVSAHVGNWEFGSRLLTRWLPEVDLSVVRLPYADAREGDLVEKVMGDRAPLIIDPSQPVAAGLAVQAALARGGVVGFLADRVFGQQPSLQVKIFGAAIDIPVGPFQAAQATGCPVVVCFVMRRGPGRYHLIVHPPWQVAKQGSRQQRRAELQRAADHFACCLETAVDQHPQQWHNFFDPWRAAVQKADQQPRPVE